MFHCGTTPPRTRKSVSRPQTIATKDVALIAARWRRSCSSSATSVLMKLRPAAALYVAAVSLAGGLVIARAIPGVERRTPDRAGRVDGAFAGGIGRKNHDSRGWKRFVAHRVSRSRFHDAHRLRAERGGDRLCVRRMGAVHAAEPAQESTASCRVQRGGSGPDDGDGGMGVSSGLADSPGCGPRRRSSNRSSARRPSCSC